MFTCPFWQSGESDVGGMVGVKKENLQPVKHHHSLWFPCKVLSRYLYAEGLPFLGLQSLECSIDISEYPASHDPVAWVEKH